MTEESEHEPWRKIYSEGDPEPGREKGRGERGEGRGERGGERVGEGIDWPVITPASGGTSRAITPGSIILNPFGQR